MPHAAACAWACAPAAYTIVNGRVVVRDGRQATLDHGPLLERHHRLAVQLTNA